ncbi:hypothetical protein [Yinghuangia soli]|uniref:Uncharacterized protein n=1 Tax=Yinghuangia soli TaxID=2908204 RepID=A0AA41PX62_9ACTN|nr:hypothetical protein [Yinghuangia soli]MCF2526479.1 hypothetical protein [Yinghuangia soli]
MNDSDMRNLLAQALPDLDPPGTAAGTEPDAVFTRVDVLRRRRRRAAAVAAGAAAAAVVAAAALVPTWTGGPDSHAAGPLPTLSATTGPATGTPSADPTTSPATGRATSAPSTAPASSASRPNTPATPMSAEDLVASFLPPDTGTVREQKFSNTPSYTVNPYSGRFLIAKDGRMGYIDVVVIDPKVNPDQPNLSLAKARAWNYCEADGVGPDNYDCKSEDLADGGIAKTWTAPPNGQEPGSPHTNTGGYSIAVTYADGRYVSIYVTRGLFNAKGYDPPLPAHPLTESGLKTMGMSTAWFRP